jgi:arginyl-tRNA synthetase
MMNAIVNQFRRIYSDYGQNDKDFTDQETKLREARTKLANATQELIKSSMRLNDVVLAHGFDLDKGEIH